MREPFFDSMENSELFFAFSSLFSAIARGCNDLDMFLFDLLNLLFTTQISSYTRKRKIILNFAMHSQASASAK
jgi:hypothetical protein